jgi:DNA-binding LytR/AlgR family response regulator
MNPERRLFVAESDLTDLRILVVEDEYLIADDLRDTLIDAKAVVLGPVATVDAAQAIVASEAVIDAALLDINLGGILIFGVADALVERRVPFAFATGYDRWSIPDRFSDVPRLEKPLRLRQVAGVLELLTARQTT